ncbi:uncharacterized protein N7484_010749 [Penicillium longicatenatum]|uniref:uncharacterized protein n=1 Tax=Penicillium longicatenatum TaxID=1561947 RepID=UPI002548EC3F|nr:uncharacterized protein N7484_010749 [Penicillium longicatenatum]KAJ5630649.1 hypothetical protein N7484_010749 [Penicillium longicatenatum]
MGIFSGQNSGLDALINRPRPGLWQQFLANPCTSIAQNVYMWRERIPAQPLSNPVSIICISDTHNTKPKCADGDILIHAGDLTQSGSFKEMQDALDWLKAQSHPTKIVIAGNHDLLLDRCQDPVSSKTETTAEAERQMLDWGDIIYLEDSETTVFCANGRRLRIYGSSHSPQHGTPAFQFPRSEDIWANTIPKDVDVLVTHCPPAGHLDGLQLGCVHLLREVWRARPRVHVFGHIHEGMGTEWVNYDGLQRKYENVSLSGGGVWNLMCVLLEFIKASLRPDVEAKGLFVNACMVGGLRDEERRDPIKVII